MLSESNWPLFRDQVVRKTWWNDIHAAAEKSQLRIIICGLEKDPGDGSSCLCSPLLPPQPPAQTLRYFNICDVAEGCKGHTDFWLFPVLPHSTETTLQEIPQHLLVAWGLLQLPPTLVTLVTYCDVWESKMPNIAKKQLQHLRLIGLAKAIGLAANE